MSKSRKDRHIYHLLQRDTKREWLGKNRDWIKRTRDRNYTHAESEKKWSLKNKNTKKSDEEQAHWDWHKRVSLSRKVKYVNKANDTYV